MQILVDRVELNLASASILGRNSRSSFSNLKILTNFLKFVKTCPGIYHAQIQSLMHELKLALDTMHPEVSIEKTRFLRVEFLHAQVNICYSLLYDAENFNRYFQTYTFNHYSFEV